MSKIISKNSKSHKYKDIFINPVNLTWNKVAAPGPSIMGSSDTQSLNKHVSFVL